MMTEDELKRFEQTASDDYEMADHGNMEMRELIAEVRRLNVAYEAASHYFFDYGGDDSDWYIKRLGVIFGTRLEDD